MSEGPLFTRRDFCRARMQRKNSPKTMLSAKVCCLNKLPERAKAKKAPKTTPKTVLFPRTTQELESGKHTRASTTRLCKAQSSTARRDKIYRSKRIIYSINYLVQAPKRRPFLATVFGPCHRPPVCPWTLTLTIRRPQTRAASVPVSGMEMSEPLSRERSSPASSPHHTKRQKSSRDRACSTRTSRSAFQYRHFPGRRNGANPRGVRATPKNPRHRRQGKSRKAKKGSTGT